MLPTIFINFCALIVHSEPNNTTQSSFPGKIPETEKKKNLSERLTQRLTCLNNFVEIRYLGFPCKYLHSDLSYFRLIVNFKGSSHKKKFKIFSKMAKTILIKFCGLCVHSNPNNMALSAFTGKILVNRNFFFLSVS